MGTMLADQCDIPDFANGLCRFGGSDNSELSPIPTTKSCFIRRISGGTQTNLRRFAAGQIANTPVTIDDTWDRYSMPFYIDNDGIDSGNFGVGNFEVDFAQISMFVWGGQSEAGYYPTSPIVTGSGHVSRARDGLVMSPLLTKDAYLYKHRFSVVPEFASGEDNDPRCPMSFHGLSGGDIEFRLCLLYTSPSPRD